MFIGHVFIFYWAVRYITCVCAECALFAKSPLVKVVYFVSFFYIINSFHSISNVIFFLVQSLLLIRMFLSVCNIVHESMPQC